MSEFIAQITVLVEDYDAAIEYYTQKLGFQVFEDIKVSDKKRKVSVGPSSSKGCRIYLAKPSKEQQLSFIGNQTGGRVFIFLYTDDFDNYYERIVKNGVKIVRPASVEPFGKAALFEDLYGNIWDLVEPKKD